MLENSDKCLIFSNLVVVAQQVTCMKTKPLIQLREMIAAALSSMTNLSKSFQSFIIETMELFLTSSGRMNFTQIARCGRSCEIRFCQCFASPVTRTIAKSFVNSCPTGGQNSPTRINLPQLGQVASNLKTKCQVVFNRRLTKLRKK